MSCYGAGQATNVDGHDRKVAWHLSRCTQAFRVRLVCEKGRGYPHRFRSSEYVFGISWRSLAALNGCPVSGSSCVLKIHVENDRRIAA